LERSGESSGWLPSRKGSSRKAPQHMSDTSVDHAQWAGLLQEYVEEEGNANVPQRYEGRENLGTWIYTQRTVYLQQKRNKGDVPKYLQDRFQCLEEIGFQWEARSAQWEHMYRWSTKNPM
jgi:hypothetical protein